MRVVRENFGVDRNGQQIHSYTIGNERGASITVLEYGAILKNVRVPDKEGTLRDVVLGYDNLADYELNPPFFGATIGRNGNRISDGKIEIKGQTYQLEKNENDRTNLHSGPEGFEKRLFTATVDEGRRSVTFSLCSPHGDEGFPGEAMIHVTYTLTEDNVVRITYDCQCDEDTIMNMTNHSYWNLNGAGNGLIMKHSLQVEAESFTPVTEHMIPTGEIRTVEGTPFDFREGKMVGQDGGVDDIQLRHAGGYDHNFVLSGEGFRKAARLVGDESGIVLDVYTDQPGLQVYAGNFIGGPLGKNKSVYGPHSGIALETQHFPDAPNQRTFPSTILPKGEVYHTVTEFRLDTL